MNNKPKIIIDTDPGHDDALAIMLLAKSDQVDIQAITTVAGNATLQDVTNNARFLVDLLKINTPLYSGAEKPLVRDQVLANVHGKGGLAGADVTKVEPLNGQAVDKIIEIVRANPHQVSLLVVGPQTNIALAIQKDPELPTLIKQIVIMGGAIEATGNKSRVAEFNIFCDPQAADIVFNCSTPKIIVPLDCCNTIPLFTEDFKKLNGSPLYDTIMPMMEHFIKGIRQFENHEGALVYDALAAYYFLKPENFTLVDMDVRIETKGEHTFGMSVADRRAYGEKSINCQVASAINRDLFVEDFLNILSK